MTRSNVGAPPRSTRYASCISRRPVDADPDEEVVLLEERGQLVVDQGSVGLDRVFDGHPGPAVLLDVAVARRKKSTPMSVGSPPCQAMVDLRDPGAPRSAGGCTAPAARRPSGSGCPGRASPWTGRSSTRSRGCRSRRSAWPAGGRQAVPVPATAPPVLGCRSCRRGLKRRRPRVDRVPGQVHRPTVRRARIGSGCDRCGQGRGRNDPTIPIGRRRWGGVG